MRRLLARLVLALARFADATVCRFANDTDDEDVPPWDDYGYTPTHRPEERP